MTFYLNMKKRLVDFATKKNSKVKSISQNIHFLKAGLYEHYLVAKEKCGMLEEMNVLARQQHLLKRIPNYTASMFI